MVHRNRLVTLAGAPLLVVLASLPAYGQGVVDPSASPAPTRGVVDASASPAPTGGVVDASASPAVPSQEVPSPQPTGSAAPEASPAPVVGLGADTLVFRDNFKDQTQWAVGSTQTGAVRYKNGKLHIDVTVRNNGLWTWHRIN